MASSEAPVSFFQRIRNRVKAIDSLLCVGLDPHLSELEEKTAEGAFNFCKDIIDATASVAVCYKPNAAFFEALGAEGVAAMKRVIAAVPEEIPVLLDAKRGDIASTAEAYAAAAFDELGADAITLSPYMGFDSVRPFLRPGRGAFVLCKTSNPTAGDLQTLPLAKKRRLLYEEVAALVASAWNADDAVGLVVGATDAAALARARAAAPAVWILAPGVGFQGGDLEAACLAGLDAEGGGLLVPVSRGISRAPDKAAAAEGFREQINAARRKKVGGLACPASSVHASPCLLLQEEFIQFALKQEVLRFGQFTLKSGRVSPYFFNAGLFSSGEALLRLGGFYAEAIVRSGVQFDVLFGPAYKGIPLVTAVAMCLASDYGIYKDFVYNRKEPKDHGEGGTLVGAAMEGRRVLVVDDVITAGTAIREAMGYLDQAGGVAAGVCLALDRQEKTREEGTASAVQEVQNEYNIPVVSVVGLNHLAAFLKNGTHGQDTLDAVNAYRQRYGVEI
ncbi:unnamed protein product [Heterosigma akashiwo]